MADTFVKIATVTVGAGGAASIDFSSIPSTYTDLSLMISGRGVNAANVLGIQLAINGIFTGSWRYLLGDGVSASSSSGSQLYAGGIDGSSATVNTFGNTNIYFPNYAGSQNKAYSSDSVTENNSSSVGSTWLYLYAGNNGSTSAINRITIYDGSTGQNLAQYSTATLYGIKNS